MARSSAPRGGVTDESDETAACPAPQGDPIDVRATMDPVTPDAPPSREQLLAMLHEAAEIEHNLMCCYL
jgi:hypothetical protein